MERDGAHEGCGEYSSTCLGMMVLLMENFQETVSPLYICFRVGDAKYVPATTSVYLVLGSYNGAVAPIVNRSWSRDLFFCQNSLSS